MRTILSRLLFYLELNKKFHWLSSYNRFYFLSEKFLFYDARFPAMTNFNSDFNKIILSKVSCNREIETNDKNAAVDRTYAHDGNVESHTADLSATQYDPVPCTLPYVPNRFPSFSPEGPRDSNVTTRVRER